MSYKTLAIMELQMYREKFLTWWKNLFTSKPIVDPDYEVIKIDDGYSWNDRAGCDALGVWFPAAGGKVQYAELAATHVKNIQLMLKREKVSHKFPRMMSLKVM